MLTARKTVLFITLLTSFTAKANFDFNSTCIKAYKEIFALRLGTARDLIEAEKRANPRNSIPYLLDNYLDYFSILTSESKSQFDRLKANKSSRLLKIENDDRNSPYYLFAMAEIHLQWAQMYGYFQEYFTSSIELNRAYNLLQENTKKYPAFLPNKKSLGVINAVLGSLPPGLKRTASIVGMKGNTDLGVNMLRDVVESLPKSPYAHFYDDAVFCLAYVETDILNNHASYQSIVNNALRIDSSSLLRSYIVGYSAIRTSHTDDAIRALNSRPAGAEYTYYGTLDYLSGIARMRKLDASAAGYFQTYLRRYSGVNYIKDTYLNLAWLALLKGNINEYNNYINLVKTKGQAIHEKDKQALNEARDPRPDIHLLKARLLFDGGAYEKAIDELKDKKPGDYKLMRDKIEFCYRLARIYDEAGRDDLALKFYQYTIDLGKNERYYFASNAAYRAGTIYEKQKNYPKAKTYYTAGLDMEDHDYERSIELQCKKGLNRIKR